MWTFKKITGHQALFVALVGMELLCVLLPVSALSSAFDFPDILRKPGSEVLPRFLAGQARIVPAYYLFLLSSLLFIPMSAAAAQLTSRGREAQLNSSSLMAWGVATALFQAIGFSRWIFMIPTLAESYATQIQARPTLILLYDAANRYLGMTVGEHLGFLAMGAWTLSLSWTLHAYRRIPKALALLGSCVALGLWLSTAEHFGSNLAHLWATLNFASNVGWTLWLAAVAFYAWGWHPKPLPLLSQTNTP